MDGIKTGRPQNRAKAKLLVVVEGDDFMRVYADQPVEVRFVETPFFQSVEGELLAEQFVAKQLPHYWKGVYESHPVAFHNVRRTTAATIQCHEFDMSILRKLKALEVR